MELALFAISALLSAVSSVTVATLYVWPWLRAARSNQALAVLVAPHLFLRFIGLSFLVPGVVSSSLPPAFAMPAAYGDLVAAILALISVLALSIRTFWTISIVWIFNMWGAVDLLFAVYQRQIGIGIGPGSLGTAFFIPTVVVPPLLVTHALIFWLLLRPAR